MAKAKPVPANFAQQILAAPIEPILKQLQITTWDVLIVGDGSGSKNNSPSGWASVLIDRETQGRRIFGGHVNAGSIAFAEAMPYVQALNWYDRMYGETRLRERPFCDVHIVTDSAVTAGVANRANESADFHTVVANTRSMSYLSAYCVAMISFRYRLHWHWQRRESSDLNVICDLLSRHHRVTGAGV